MNLRDIAKQCDSDSHRWFPDTANDVFFMVAAMAGEAGEAINVAKKVRRESLLDETITRERLLEEVTDVLVYVMNIYGMLDADPQWWYDEIRHRNEKRFGKTIKHAFDIVKDDPRA